MTTNVINILSSLPLKSGSLVLSIGASSLSVIDNLVNSHPKAILYAILSDKDKIDTLHSKNVKAIYKDIDNGNTIPLKRDLFDVVILHHTLRNIIYRESVLRECYRVLKSGGLLFVVESGDVSWGVDTGGDSRILFDDMLEYLDNAGFTPGVSFDTKFHEYGIIGVCPMQVGMN